MGAMAEIEEIIKKVQKVTPFEYEMKYDYMSGVPTNTSPDNPLIITMLDAINDLTGKEMQPTGYKQGSDARYFAPLNIPIAIYGPSDPAVGHSPNERVSVDQLYEAAKVYALTAIRTLGIAE
jgi:succinyl-diaminopimelate desuccinylase